MNKHAKHIAGIATAIFLGLAMLAGAVSAQTTAFTYQGRLTVSGTAASGTYQMQFALYDALSGGTQIGSTITNSSVQVAGGAFSVWLDFGSSAFPGADRFLEIRVYDNATSGYITLTPRQQITSAPYSVKTVAATSADSLSAACTGCVTNTNINDVSANKLTGSVAVTNGGTGATTAANARTNLGLGTLATLSPTGTANSTTYLRGDNTWATFSGLSGGGTTNFVPKFTGASTIGNSLIQDNGTSLSINVAPSSIHQLYVQKVQLTAAGDGQSTIYGYRTRDSQNDGTGYGVSTNNSAVLGYNYWGDVYSFGVAGFSWNDYTRTGGVLGAEQSGAYWGSLGYKSSNSQTYGVYGSAAYASGTGLTTEKQGIGGGFYGGLIGSWSRGGVMGSVATGEMFASYNLGNVYNSGFSADLVSVSGNASDARVAAYANTSTELKVYDNGAARLSGESVFVPFTDDYKAMLGATPNVTITPVGSPAQLYIKSIEKDGFIVAVAQGTADVTFNWIAVGTRIDSTKAGALPNEVLNGTFDQTLKDAMNNEGDLTKDGKPIWWDGEKIRTDKAPEAANAPKAKAKPGN